MKSFQQMAQSAYEAYCKQAGGKTLYGDPLPPFEELGVDHQACWIAVVRQLLAEFAALH